MAGNQYAKDWTPERFEFVKGVLARHPTVASAAREIGCPPGAIKAAFQRVGLLSSDFTKKPDWTQTMPDGQRLRGNSTLLEGDQKTVREKWVKTERGSEDPAPEVPHDFAVKKVSINTDGQGFERQRWTQHFKDEQTRFDQFFAAVKEQCAQVVPLPPTARLVDAHDGDWMTVIPMGDPHIGLLSWGRETGDDHDLNIAEKDLTRAIDMVVDRSPKSARAVLVNVGDFWHAQDDKQLTPTAGHKLDVDSRWGKVLRVGLRIQERLCRRMLEKFGKVESVNVPGNHDPGMAIMLAEWLKAVFRNEPRMHVYDAFDPYQYIRHGKVFIGVHHGDGAKMENLGEIMATRRAKDWGETTYRMWITGHIHHKRTLELPGCDVESFNTLAGKDYWTHWKGFESKRYISAITFDAEYGPVHREIVDLRAIRAADGREGDPHLPLRPPRG